MSPHYQGDRVTLHHGNCLDVLRELPDCSVDAVITDPPYGLANTTPEKITETVIRWANGERDYLPGGKGFMGNPWDSFVPPAAVWDDCLRVLKPGGHVLAFAGSRTVDLMTLGLRMGGFEIRDSIAWLYGSGFPKSLDVSKAIDKQNGRDLAARYALARHIRERREAAGVTRAALAGWFPQYREVTANWERCDPGNRVPTLSDWATLAPRLNLAKEWLPLVQRVEAEREVVGARKATDRRGDGTVVGLGHSGNADITAPATPEAVEWQGWGTALKPAFEPVVVARKPLAAGTVAGNVLAYGTGALNIDGCRIESGDDYHDLKVTQGGKAGGGFDVGSSDGTRSTTFRPAAGRWPANVVLDESQAQALDQMSGNRPSSGGAAFDKGGYTNASHGLDRNDRREIGYGDTGGASRFFYVAKAGKSERPNVDGVAHPTVKPLALMRWLVRLVTPPGGTVLEPFSGSGTTIEAALLEGFNVIGIEREAEYLPLIEARIARALNTDADLFGGAA